MWTGRSTRPHHISVQIPSKCTTLSVLLHYVVILNTNLLHGVFICCLMPHVSALAVAIFRELNSSATSAASASNCVAEIVIRLKD
jgi:hypothetical protein